jgi:hypothetical protein
MEGGYGEYAVPLLPACALAVAVTSRDLVARMIKRGKYVLISVLIVVAIASGWIQRPQIDTHLLEDARDAAGFVRESVAPDQWVVTSMPEVAVAALRSVPFDLAMGKFAFTESMSESKAAWMHMVTPARLVALLEDPRCGAVVLSAGQSWNFAWSLPELVYTSAAGMKSIKDVVNARFEVAFTSSNYVVLLPRGRGRAAD